jgi:hypothetical protein
LRSSTRRTWRRSKRPGVGLKKLFFVVTKLERLTLESLFQPYLIFVSEAGAYPSGATQSGLFKYYSRLERLAGESALAYLVSLSVTKKRFITLITFVSVMKHFFLRH